MKKLLLCLIVLLLVTGCGEEKSLINEDESQYYGDVLQCFREDETISYRIWIYQNPETKELTHASITSFEKLDIYDENGKKIKIDVEDLYCSDYNKEIFNKCKAEMYSVGLGNEKDHAMVKYDYNLNYFDQDYTNKETALDEIKVAIEKEYYTCDIIR